MQSTENRYTKKPKTCYSTNSVQYLHERGTINEVCSNYCPPGRHVKILRDNFVFVTIIIHKSKRAVGQFKVSSLSFWSYFNNRLFGTSNPLAPDLYNSIWL